MNLLATQDGRRIFLSGDDAEEAVSYICDSADEPPSVGNYGPPYRLHYEEKSMANHLIRNIERWQRHDEAPWESKKTA